MELLPPPTPKLQTIEIKGSAFNYLIKKMDKKEGISIKFTEETPNKNVYYTYEAEMDKLIKDIKILYLCKNIDDMIQSLEETFDKGNVRIINRKNKLIMVLEFVGLGITKSEVELEEHECNNPISYLTDKIKDLDVKYNEILKEVSEIKKIKLTINEEKKKKLAKEVEKKMNLNLEDKIKNILLKKDIKDKLFEDMEERMLLKLKEMIKKEKENEGTIKIQEKNKPEEEIKKMINENVQESLKVIDNIISGDKNEHQLLKDDIRNLNNSIKEKIKEIDKIKSSLKKFESLNNSFQKVNQYIQSMNNNNYIEIEVFINDEDLGKDIILLKQWDTYKYFKNFEPEDIDIIIYGEKIPAKYKDINNELNEDNMNFEMEKNVSEILNTKYSFYYNFSRKGYHSIKIEFKKKLISCENLFLNCERITSINLSNFDCSQVTSCSGMFSGCISLKSIDFGKLDFSLVTSFKNMFYNCQNLPEINLFNFNTKNALTFESMFKRCFNLKNIDVSNFNLLKCQKIEGMFMLCQSITEIDLMKWNMYNISSYQGISELFYGCKNLKKIKMSADFKNIEELFKDSWGDKFCKKDIFIGIPETGHFTYKKGVKCELLINELPKDWHVDEE